MSLTFEHDINLSGANVNVNPLLVEQGVVIAEKDSSLRMYYIYKNLTSDKTSALELANYGTLKFKNIMKHLTSRAVSRIGIKTFPGIGSYGFFKYKYEDRSIVICPINNNQTKFTAPKLVMTQQTNNTLKFSIISPADITYQCYRIVLRNEEFTIEYITYEPSIVVPKPDVNGVYTIYCIGYVNEGERISYDSNVLSLTITGGKATFEPSTEISYYTKEQVKEMFASLMDKYLKEAAFVEGGTKLQFTMSDNETFYASGSPAGVAYLQR